MVMLVYNIKIDKIFLRDCNGNKIGVCSVKKNSRDD